MFDVGYSAVNPISTCRYVIGQYQGNRLCVKTDNGSPFADFGNKCELVWGNDCFMLRLNRCSWSHIFSPLEN
jgi:hypothetical protein